MDEHVSATLEALKAALSPKQEVMSFEDGDIIAWRKPEAMTSNTVNRMCAYSSSADEWFWGDGSRAGEWRDIIQKLMAEEVIDVSFIPARYRIPLT